ncbi:MAG: peptidoglycan DD-metalloendopeptidase family protein [bacterium]|nr:peptidoglycan DD-metalloendopeptidase family protein [bacterium]
MSRKSKLTLVWILALAISGVFLVAEKNYKLFSRDIVVKKEITAGSTFSLLANSAGLATATVNQILESSKSVYDLAMISAGKELEFIYDEATGQLKKLIYEINSEEKLVVKNTATSTVYDYWEAIREQIKYTTEIATAKGIIESSLYQTMVDQQLDQRLAIALAEVFAWQIDFAGEIQTGDSFKVIYEKRFRDGEYAMPGKILAAEFINDGRTVKGFYFPGGESKEGYYEENGNSVQKVFLKSPLQYRYISSGFSYARKNPVTGIVTAHRGLDLVANAGTPAVTIGDGTVVQAGWNGAYGISVKVRHNDTYSSVYGHFQSLAKGIRVGAKVKQGQIVGYVGSTGQSTGPHLHYEIHKFGTLVNPLKVEVPAGEALKEGDRARFGEIVSQYNRELNSL